MQLAYYAYIVAPAYSIPKIELHLCLAASPAKPVISRAVIKLLFGYSYEVSNSQYGLIMQKTVVVSRNSKTSPAKHKNPNPSHDSNEVDSQLYDWLWTYQEEPHRTRRQLIIKAHPEVTKLCGPEPLTKYVVGFVVILQFLIAYSLRDTPVFSWKFLLTAYVIGGTANQNLFLAIHEISHNLAFKKPFANRLLAIVANLPIGIPYSASFRPYHLTHHKSLGVEGLDVDLPTSLEAVFLDSVLGKAFFATFQIFFYALRPMVIYRIPFTWIHFFNVITQVAVDAIFVKFVGWNVLWYFFWSSFLAGSLHPCAGHFIAEHYVFEKIKERSSRSSPSDALPVETYSYYGVLNFLTYNVGLHNEHHDFPAIPWTRLWKLRDIATEFYEPLPQHKSWTYVIWQFIWDPNVSLWSRVKRDQTVGKGRKVGGGWTKEELGQD
ncbi:hypothetical protein TWF106_002751 [Orbilia oligospora]|uniref:sphingolipid 4-desaturase n=2 Tax=Orbilia oligospora TaxID=2813651 RepID=A0A6G1LRZ0_ORBOL|nr:hypothetical protein TWF788_003764 [Orbilia oligospora]KAF3201705.1 hypothetical protein TWF106_002751 [Orbilia oligospora]KAF3233027.1 hypothetical protein TWF192_002575 [Orbilia oligospora]